MTDPNIDSDTHEPTQNAAPEPAQEPIQEEAQPEGIATRCGFVTVLGAPNAGKSSLVNALVGTKVSIVSPKVQTTRTRVTGILALDGDQIVFVDTPGIFKTAKRPLEQSMLDRAWQEANDGDRLMLVIDAAPRQLSEDVEHIIERLSQEGRKATLVLNKVDLVTPDKLLPLAERLNETGLFEHTFMVSAKTGSGLAELEAHLRAGLAPGPWLFPEDEVTDLPNRLLASEITREKLFLRLHQELPYNLTVETEAWQVGKDGSIRVEQVVYVTRANHKGIVLGKGGSAIKHVGAAARRELQDLFGRQVHLFLFVKVRENWMNDPERYRQMGLTLRS